jgi:site-specific recombinase XerD
VSGVDIIEIQALLGHSSIMSTQIYTHTSSAKLKSAVKKLDEISWG